MDALLRLHLILVFLLSFFLHETQCQGIRLDSITSLAVSLTESSGFIYLNDKLIMHNDSGHEAALYEVDTLSGNISRKVVIGNANNIDWEDISYDDTYIYIGDFGNNFGTRQDLRVYKALISDFQSQDTIMAESIFFAYTDQLTFSSNRFQTNFDAEGLISWGDSLYIFTKNWANSRTNIYPLSKTPGTYSISKTDSIDAQGLVTGASLDQRSGDLWMCGYTSLEAFVIQVKEWTGSAFSTGEISKYPLEIKGSFQVEAITRGPGNLYYLSAEGNASVPAVLYGMSIEEPDGILSYESPYVKVFPVPASNQLVVESIYSIEIVISTLEGKRVLHASSKEIDVSELPAGLYILKVFVPEKDQLDVRKILIVR